MLPLHKFFDNHGFTITLCSSQVPCSIFRPLYCPRTINTDYRVSRPKYSQAITRVFGARQGHQEGFWPMMCYMG